jgi:hypothetical protein
MLAIKLAIEIDNPKTNCQKGAPFINTNMEAIPPIQLPSKIETLIKAKCEN